MYFKVSILPLFTDHPLLDSHLGSSDTLLDHIEVDILVSTNEYTDQYNQLFLVPVCKAIS